MGLSFDVAVGTYTGYALSFFTAMSLIGASLAVLQENKIWKAKELPSLTLWGKLKVFTFNIVWFHACLAGILLITTKWFLTLGSSDISKDANRMVENFVGRTMYRAIVGRVHVKGLKNLPPEDLTPAPVYIANHGSQIDVASIYFLGRRFKWISKKSVLFLPGVGLLMWLGKHVFIDRKRGKNAKAVVSTLFQKSNDTVQAGVPIFLFPQGTRRIAERMPAKEGAFIIAQTNKSPLVPVSIEIPETAWNSLYPLNVLWGGEVPIVKITVHPMVTVSGAEDREKLKLQCMDKIYGALPTYDGHKKDK